MVLSEIKLIVHVPELKRLGEKLMAGLAEIKEAVIAQGDAIAAELEQLGQRQTIDPAEVTALAEMVRENTARIQGMIPDEPAPEG